MNTKTNKKLNVVIPSLSKAMIERRTSIQKQIGELVNGITDEQKLCDLNFIVSNLKQNSMNEIIKYKVEHSKPTPVFVFDERKISWSLMQKLPSVMRKKGSKEEKNRIDEILKAVRVISRNLEKLKKL